MPKSLAFYADPVLAQQYRNYQRFQNYYGDNINRKVTRKRWSAKEDKMVLAHEIKDRELAKLLNRTVPAIQQRRNELRKREQD